jgi:hypothetical protein
MRYLGGVPLVPQHERSTTTVVFFLGGCTYTEIAALRWAGRQNQGARLLCTACGVGWVDILTWKLRAEVLNRDDGHSERSKHCGRNRWCGTCGRALKGRRVVRMISDGDALSGRTDSTSFAADVTERPRISVSNSPIHSVVYPTRGVGSFWRRQITGPCAWLERMDRFYDHTLCPLF